MAWFSGDPSAMHTAYGQYVLVTLEDVCYFSTPSFKPGSQAVLTSVLANSGHGIIYFILCYF